MTRRCGLLVRAMLLAKLGSGCAVPECTQPDYREAECRVLAENELARLRTGNGVEVRFQGPRETVVRSWDARGRLALRDGEVWARVAGAGSFAISLQSARDTALGVTLENIDRAADVSVIVGRRATPIAATDAGLTRHVDVRVPAGEPVWIRGQRACPSRFRIAVVADVQDNPLQFTRILERLSDEHEQGQADGEPLVAIVVPGDVTERSLEAEFDRFEQLVQAAPVPVVLTPGNHDIYRADEPHFTRSFGPGNHVSEVCGLRLVSLDTGSGALAPSVLARLPELLARGDANHVIVAVHHPPFAGITASGWSREDAAQRLLVEAAIAQADLIVAGHMHALRDFPDISVGNETLRQVVVGTGGAFQGLGQPRFGYLRVSLGPTGLQTCFVDVLAPGYANSGRQADRSSLSSCE